MSVASAAQAREAAAAAVVSAAATVVKALYQTSCSSGPVSQHREY